MAHCQRTGDASGAAPARRHASGRRGRVHDLALRRLAQLAPDEARPLILREIQKPQRGATLKTLGSLPDAELPNLDDVLAANFEADGYMEIHAALVERYADQEDRTADSGERRGSDRRDGLPPAGVDPRVPLAGRRGDRRQRCSIVR